MESPDETSLNPLIEKTKATKKIPATAQQLMTQVCLEAMPLFAGTIITANFNTRTNLIEDERL